MRFEPGRVLVAIDFRDCSAAALRLGTAIAGKFSAPLTVLHVIPPPEPDPLPTGHVRLPVSGEILSAAENDVVVFIRSVIGRKPMPDRRIVEGDPAEAILFAAGYEKAGLIVLGTRGAGGSSRLTLGSVAEQVLRLTTVPVLTICPRRATRRKPSTLRRILCPVDDSPVAERAMAVAVSLGKRFESEVIALQLSEKGSRPMDGHAQEQRLRRWIRRVAPGTPRPTPRIVAGEGADAVLRYVEQNEIDLVVVGARREPFGDETVFGTTTERVTRHATSAVLTVTVMDKPPRR